MTFNFDNFFDYRNKNKKMGHFQDLEHIDGLSISTTSANLYNRKRDDLVMFYFRDGANYASVYTQSKIVSENIKWNQNIKSKKIRALLVNTRNANAFTGKEGYKSLKILAEDLSTKLSEKQKIDEEKPSRIKSSDIIFACTGTIGEKFPTDKIFSSIPDLINKIKYTQNKYIWIKAAMGILTTDLVPKLAMEECFIGNKKIKIYGLAKGSGMIYPNMATTLGFIFTDASIPTNILQKLLKKNITNSFNAITCDGDTSTNDMVSIFATGKANNVEIKNINDEKLKNFEKSLFNVLLNLAKRVAADGEGASKFVSIRVKNCKSDEEAKKISFSIANSPLVKTAIAGEDPNWGRVIMAIGKSNVNIKLNKLNLNFGPYKIIENGILSKSYQETEVASYMKGENIDILVDIGIGKKEFTAYTMDFTKKYIEINSDYRS
jgi:glutamate N-acetyltransferase/amino-acid N-acetyltransferase